MKKIDKKRNAISKAFLINKNNSFSVITYEKAKGLRQIVKTKNGTLLQTFVTIIVVSCIVGSVLITITPRLVVAQATLYEVSGEAQPIDAVPAGQKR